MWPLIRLTGDRSVMGEFANGPWLRGLAWGLFALVTAANGALLWSLIVG